jgi:MinD-like ATPase involved in chromosome partitioning or flagellar assembly
MRDMNAPDSLRRIEDEDGIVREYDYDEEHVIVVDIGAGANEATIDLVGDTAIIVSDDEQFEIELPADATDVHANNGVLTITA